VDPKTRLAPLLTGTTAKTAVTPHGGAKGVQSTQGVIWYYLPTDSQFTQPMIERICADTASQKVDVHPNLLRCGQILAIIAAMHWIEGGDYEHNANLGNR
jgi:hypothetical protein